MKSLDGGDLHSEFLISSWGLFTFPLLFFLFLFLLKFICSFFIPSFIGCDAEGSVPFWLSDFLSLGPPLVQGGYSCVFEKKEVVKKSSPHVIGAHWMTVWLTVEEWLTCYIYFSVSFVIRAVARCNTLLISVSKRIGERNQENLTIFLLLEDKFWILEQGLKKFLIIAIKIIKQWGSFFDLALPGKDSQVTQRRGLGFENTIPFMSYIRRLKASHSDIQSCGREGAGIINLLYKLSIFSDFIETNTKLI